MEEPAGISATPWSMNTTVVVRPGGPALRRSTRTLTAIVWSTTLPLVQLFADCTQANAAANPGQPVLNDYGQSAAEVTAEVTAAVNANAAVIKARAVLAAAHKVTLAKIAAERTAYNNYLLAVRSKVATRIAATRKAYYAAHAATLAARKVEATDKARLAALITSTTAAIRARHYRPVDGTWTGDAAQYFIPGIGLEPIQVQISLYGGHVSDISVPQYASTGDSAAYNAMALPVLMEEAMVAHDTARVASVTGATLTSGAFAKSLLSALTKAGFKY